MRSLSSIERYLQLTYALRNINFDIIGLSEVRKMGCNIEEYQDYILCYIGQSKGLYGVGFLIKKSLKNNIVSFTGVSERIALLQLKFEDWNISIIQVYAPTESSTEIEIEKFYKELEKAHTLTNNKLIVIGDFNAKIGYPKKEENIIMGKYGYGKRNKQGERLIEYALEYKLSITNTFFKKKPSKKWTWQSPDEKVKNEIDFILTNMPKLVTDCEVINNIEFPSDHRLVRTTLQLILPKKSRIKFNNIPRIPETEMEITNFRNCLNSRIEAKIEGITNVQNYYDVIEEAILYSSTINTNSRVKENRNKIFSENSKSLIKRRTELAFTKNKTKDMKVELSQLYKETKKSIRKDYSDYRQKIIKKNLKKYKSTKRAFKELNLHNTWIQRLGNKSNTIVSRDDILVQATNFYKELYTKKDEEFKVEQEIKCTSKIKTIDVIHENEIYERIKQLKSDKSPGPDRISNEIVKISTPVLLKYLTQLFNMILDTEIVPKQWCMSDIVLLYKKGNPLDIANYRPISLLVSIYKLFSSIILRRITKEIDKAQPIEQAGFRSGFSTIDHIQTLEQVIEKYNEFNRPLYLAFIDYNKAFDSISHNSLWTALKQFNVDQKYINILIYIYSNNYSQVKLETKGSKIKIERGVRQGDPLSPKLFIAVLENIFQNLNWKNKGIKINRCYLSHLRFADDIVVLAETAKELENLIYTLDQESFKVGLEMNTTKTKIMTNSLKIPIKRRENNIEYVDKYIYLGKQVSFNKINNEEEIGRRCNITWKKFWSLKEILKGDYSINMKKIVFDTCLLPCLLYASQTWIFTKKVKQKITTTQRAMERSILGLRKIHKIKNEKIRQRTKLTDAVTHALRIKWQWAGHISRFTDNRWTFQSTKWTGPRGKRNVGRPIRRWTDDILEYTGKDWFMIGRNRELWRKMEEAFTQRGVHIQESKKKLH